MRRDSSDDGGEVPIMAQNIGLLARETAVGNIGRSAHGPLHATVHYQVKFSSSITGAHAMYEFFCGEHMVASPPHLFVRCL